MLSRWLDRTSDTGRNIRISRIVKDWERGLEGSRAGETINGIPMESGEISYGPEDRSVDYVE